MLSKRRLIAAKTALLLAALTLAICFAATAAFAEPGSQNQATGQSLTAGTTLSTEGDGPRNQNYDFVPGNVLHGVKVRIRPAGSHKPVSVKDNGKDSQNDLILYYLGEATHLYLEQADDNSYKIRFFKDFANQNVKTDKAHILDVERSGSDSSYYQEGQKIHMVSDSDESALNKRWQFIRQDDGTYWIMNKRSGLFWSLKDTGKPKDNDNQIVQRKEPMKWEIELVSTSDFSPTSMANIKQYDSLNFSFGGDTVTSLNWMSFLPSDMPLSDLSIPGTHDAATARIDTSDKESRRTQQYYIDEMLMAGVRHFDTRLGWEDDRLTLVHSSDGDALNHRGQDLTLEEVMGWMTTFLQANPSETLIMQIMADEKEETVEKAALQYLGNIAKQPNSIIWSGDHVPTLGEARGKIVIISRFNKVSNRDFSTGDGKYWALDVGGWRQSDEYPAYDEDFLWMTGPTINSTAQPDGTKDKWDNCEVWVQDSYSHTPHETTFKTSKRPYIVGGLDGIVADYFDFDDHSVLYGDLYPEGTYGAQYRRDAALKKNKRAWVFNFTNCSANGLGYHYRGNAKEIHQWIYDNDWIIRDDMFTGVLANDYTDELLTSKIYRTNFAGGAGGWGDATYHWSSDYATCTASRTWRGAAGFTETETVDTTRTSTPASCTTPGSTEITAEFTNEGFDTQIKRTEGDPALGHEWDAGVVTTEPSCTRNGVKTYTCMHEGCAQTKTEVVPKKEHAPGVRHQEQDEESGLYYLVVRCQVCNEVLSRELDGDGSCSHANTETADLTVREADCINPELVQRTVKCTDCGKVVSTQLVESKPALGHSWGETTYEWNESPHLVTVTRICTRGHVEAESAPYVSTSLLAPTCTIPGSRYYVSSHLINEELGNVYDEQGNNRGMVSKTESVPALGHDWGAGEITKPSTCTEDGLRVYTCARCGDTKTEVLPAMGHSWDAVYEWSEDAATCTATQTCLRDDSHRGQSAQGSVSFEVTKMPTATEAGVRTYTATFDVDWAETQVATQEIAPIGDDVVSYLATKGSCLWVKGASSTLPFTFERTQLSDTTFDHFTGVLIDGKLLAQDSFTARSGSVIIDLLPAYLNALPTGTHTIQPTFDDGGGEAHAFVVMEVSKPDDGGNGGSSGGGEGASGAANSDAGSALGGSGASAKPVSSQGGSALGKTGDSVPVAVVCILAIASLACVVVARKKLQK